MALSYNDFKEKLYNLSPTYELRTIYSANGTRYLQVRENSLGVIGTVNDDNPSEFSLHLTTDLITDADRKYIQNLIVTYANSTFADRYPDGRV